ncbi:MAG: hypothetical protein ACE5JJ_00705, partial [Nitrospinota bacterium]
SRAGGGVDAAPPTRAPRGEGRLLRRYRARADGLYESLPPGERGGAFEKLHAAFFEELGFSSLLQRGVEEFPALSERLEGLFVFPAAHEREEGVELGREAPRLGLRLRAERFAEPDGLARFLRRALTRASLLLDEPFGYRPEEVPGRRGPRAPGERCPLCEFPTHAWSYPSGGAQAEVVAAIREDFPHWAPEDGLCSRCLEGYRLRVAWGAKRSLAPN